MRCFSIAEHNKKMLQLEIKKAEKNNNNRFTALYLGQPWLAGTITLRNIISQTQYWQYTTLIVLKFLEALPTFRPRLPSLPLGSNTKENLGKQQKKTQRMQRQECTFPLYSPNSTFDKAIG